MQSTFLTTEVEIHAPIQEVWNKFTQAEHVQHWNFASPDWHCPKAENQLTVGEKFSYTMAAKDGSFQFDFEGIFTKIEAPFSLEYTLLDNRKVTLNFSFNNNKTTVIQHFEPETQNSLELQQQGWQAIQNNFKVYCELDN